MLNPKLDVHSSLLIGQTTYLRQKYRGLVQRGSKLTCKLEFQARKRNVKTTKDYNTSPASPSEKWVTVSTPSSRAVTRQA